MKTNLIIGAGQLGSRHLQGLLKFDKCQQAVYVIDPSLDSLNNAKLRASEIKSNHEVRFLADWKNLPKEFDLAIVATNADIREKVVTKLLQNHRVNYLVLEKVLFQDIEAYSRINDLINKNNISTWVNHPRRMFSSYQVLKNQINNGNSKNYQYSGGNWGLGCNALHFLDLFEYLSDSKVKTIDTEWINSTITESKRKGFFEFTGSIKGTLENNSTFQITSLEGDISGGTITIFENENRYIVQESGTPQVIRLKKENQFKPEFLAFTMEYQSTLTAILAEDIFIKGICNLPTYNEAMYTHKLFITSLLEKYNSITGLNSKILPIT